MKKTLSFMVMALALLLTQCRKPEVKFPTPSSAEGVTVSMTVTAGPGSKTDITDEGAITWSEGDKIYVGDGTHYVGYLTITDGVGEATGTFTGDVTVTPGTHTFHFYYLGSSDYTGILTSGTSATVDVDFSSQDIHADGSDNLTNASGQHVGYGKAESVTVAEGQQITGLQVSMKSKVAIAYFSFTKVADGDDYTGALTLSGDHICNKMTVDFSGDDFEFSGTKGCISLAVGHAQRYVMLVPPANVASETLNFSGGATGSTTFENGIEANKFYRINGNMPIEVKVKKGPFTVDEYGTTVEFSKGNLQYLGQAEEGHKWRFAEHQWDYMGDGPNITRGDKGNVNLGTEYEGKYNTGSGTAGPDETPDDKAAARDLFGWGATGFQDTRANAFQTNYQPYSTCNADVGEGNPAYNINRYGYGPDYDANKYGLTVADKSDWGCLAIGDDPAGTWRTLVKGEWDYLLNTSDGDFGRRDANRFAKAKVNGVKGMLIFPDGYNGGTAIGSITGVAAVNSISASCPDSNIPTDIWKSMETAGVVFLPAAGYRNGTSLGNVGACGSYWSKTPNGDPDSNGSSAYTLYFDSSLGQVTVYTYSDDRCLGLAVRLVR